MAHRLVIVAAVRLPAAPEALRIWKQRPMTTLLEPQREEEVVVVVVTNTTEEEEEEVVVVRTAVAVVEKQGHEQRYCHFQPTLPPCGPSPSA